MAEPISDKARNVVPRWRRFSAAAETGTLHGTGREPPLLLQVPDAEIEALEVSWRRKSSPLSALELIDTCIVAGVPERAVAAADFLLQHPDPKAQSAARYILMADGTLSDPLELSKEDRYRRIADFRRRLRFIPNNPVLWVDLAREYVSLGQPEPAERALRIARGLAPQNRFVLRASSRFHLHERQYEYAYELLRRSERTTRDPWLLAAELAAAHLAEKTSRHMKLAASMVESRSHSPWDISELASALATHEMADGTRRQARRLFRRALEMPTENSVAQATWAAPRLDLTVPKEQLEVPRAFEARAWEAYRTGQYPEAFRLARLWLQDEPFATRPADFGAWVASNALEDYRSAITIAEAAHEANPEDVSLCLHLAFSLACENELTRAEEKLNYVQRLLREERQDVDPERVTIFIQADRGLIAFRRNQPELGRSLYEQALLLAREKKAPELIIAGMIYWGREEVHIGSPLARTLLEQAKAGIEHMNETSRPIYAKKIDELLKRTAESAPPARPAKPDARGR